MKLSHLLPRPLDPASGSETVTLLNALFARTHLDRRLARRIGWRGMRPSFSHVPAWTARVAGSASVFGLVFLDETAEQGLITGRFAVYVFPDAGQAEAEGASPEMAAAARDPGYRGRIRELSAEARSLGAFAAGELELTAAEDGSGLEMTVSARAVRRRRLPDGTLEPPCRPFRRMAPFQAVLAQSLSAALEETGELVLFAERVPGLAILSHDPFEEAESDSAEETLLSVSQAFGRFRGLLPGRRMKRLYFAHRPSPEEARNLPVIHILTGFLGAGKTTFLRGWLADLHGRERFTGVIQNEFGEADLDSLVLRGETRVEALDDGCVCCSLADSLRPGIERLLAATPAEQFVLETTGVADPMNVMYSLLALSDLVERGLLITVADAYDLTRREGLEAGTPESDVRLRQIMNADVIVCAKADAVEEPRLEALMQALHRLNGDALILPAFHGEAPYAVLDKFYWHRLDERREASEKLASREAPRPIPGETEKPQLFGRSGWQAASRGQGASAFDTFSLSFEKAVPMSEIQRAVRDAGPGLSRAKGIVEIEGEGPHIIQYAAGILGAEPADEGVLAAWQRAAGSSHPRGFLVFIGTCLKRPASLEEEA